jgi:hypothetical protein
MCSIGQVGEPAIQDIIASFRLRDDGTSTVDENAPQVRIATLGDAVD